MSTATLITLPRAQCFLVTLAASRASIKSRTQCFLVTWARRYVFQAVHMLFEGNPERSWQPGEKRVSKMVIIGKELDKGVFEQAFNNCIAKPRVAPAGAR